MKVWIFILLCLIALPARAQDVSKQFCPALQDDGTYNGRYDSYRKLVPGSEGWIFRSESELKSDFKIDDVTLRMLKEFQDTLKARGSDLVMLYVPTRGMVHADKAGFKDAEAAWTNYGAMVKKVDAAGVALVGLDQPAVGAPFFYARDHHWNVFGAKAAADAVASYIKTLDVSLPKVSFVTKTMAAIPYAGTFGKVFQKICHTDVPPEIITPEQAERADTASDAQDLFGDGAAPSVVLVGTSNSTPQVHANFDGALKQALSADVLNDSVAGAGIDHPMMSYLTSDHYKNNKGKVIVWEIPGYYNLDSLRRFLRQAIPAAKGDCDAPLKEAKALLTAGTQSLFSGLGPEMMAGSEYYLSLKFDKGVTAPFTADFGYSDKREPYAFKYSDRVLAPKEFFVSLRNKKKMYLDDVVLEVPAELSGANVTAHLCKM